MALLEGRNSNKWKGSLSAPILILATAHVLLVVVTLRRGRAGSRVAHGHWTLLARCPAGLPCAGQCPPCGWLWGPQEEALGILVLQMERGSPLKGYQVGPRAAAGPRAAEEAMRITIYSSCWDSTEVPRLSLQREDWPCLASGSCLSQGSHPGGLWCCSGLLGTTHLLS